MKKILDQKCQSFTTNSNNFLQKKTLKNIKRLILKVHTC